MNLYKQMTCIVAFLVTIVTASFAQQLAPVEVGLRHLESKFESLGLTKTDIENYRVSDHYMSKHNGVTHIYLIQQHAGVDVQRALININVLPSGEILNMGNRYIGDIASKVNTSTPTVELEAAIQKAASRFDLEIPAELTFREVKNGYTLYDNGDFLLEPIRCKLVYEKMSDDEVKLAWQIELYRLDGQNWWNVRMDATNNTVLNFDDQVIHCSFSLEEGCNDPSHDHHHHAAASPTKEKKSPAKKNTSSVKADENSLMVNSYNVYAMPLESPNHGDRSIVVNPENMESSPLGWHDNDPGTQGEFTITRGNNVHAYHDIFNQNASSNDEPDGGSTLDFDFPIVDPNLPYENVDAAIVNLFYWNNLVHDVFYLKGFDEATGNFQASNFGNGGQGSDEVQAHGLDGGGTNNANFGSGVDGDNGRMQMFLWGNNITLPENAASVLIVETPANVAGEYEMVPAQFGGGLPVNPIVAEVVIVEDGVDISTDGCEPLTNGADLVGKIAMVDRGLCQFGDKVLAAENAGAIAVIVCNNAPGPPVAMAPGDLGGQVTIPAVMITQESCDILRVEIPGLETSLGQTGAVIPSPGPVATDSDFDNGVIVHEYGHGISTRSTGGPSQSNCLFNDQQAGEGWSDWFGLVMQTTSDDTPNERRGIGTFLNGQPTTGTGIRTFPYSRDMNINPHTYADIGSVAIPHGVGSIFAATLWDLYWNMVDEHGFVDDIYSDEGGNNMTIQLVMDGLKLQSCSPSFNDSRDAIIAADIANNGGANVCIIWETFARRGLGVNSTESGGVDFTIPDACNFTLRINKTASVQDIEVGGTIDYTVTARNATTGLLQNITITDEIPEGTTYVAASATCPNTTVANGVISIDFETLAVADSVSCQYSLRVDDDPSSVVLLEDKVEEPNIIWDAVSRNTFNETTWEVGDEGFEGQASWFANNIGPATDQYLETKFEYALTSPDAVLSFWHKYDTQDNRDGGVVEISTNGGGFWIDLNNLIIQNGYNGSLQNDNTNELSGRPAFTGDSNGWVNTLVNLSAYQDRDVKIRFRFATGVGGASDGWHIDNIRLFGDFYAITNEACVSSALNENVCSEAITTVLGQGTFVSTEDVENDLKISIAPNPTTGTINLTLNSSDLNDTPIVSILSVDGKLLRNEELPQANGTFPISLKEYPSGMYFIQIQSGKDIVTEKIILR